MMNINDNILNIVAQTLWDRKGRKDDWLWDGHDQSHKNRFKQYAREEIEQLNEPILNRWIEEGKISDEVIAKSYILIRDAIEYRDLQRERIESITDPILKKSVMENIKDYG